MSEVNLRLWLEQHGLSLSIVWDPMDRQRFLLGLGLTLLLSLASIALSLLIGVVGAAGLGSRQGLWRGISGAYVALFRNTPLLVQLFFFYFGVGALLPLVDGVRLLNGTQWAIIVIALHSGAFQAVNLRAGIDGVPRATLQAAAALGMQERTVLRHIVLPLALRNSLPAMGNTVVQTIKSTSIAYAIAVPELLYASNRIWSDNFNVAEMMQVLLLVWLLLIGLSSWLLRRLEYHLRLPGQELPNAA
ncbi:amino acid ABC transporter permease [Pseudomonas sivasensis]|jgi:polar amino acid transport system permease protein|uniref:amino acid ABC transporter permease n=1 Tax=Pseudomonas TaxID=286 RepID=UPI00044E3CDE|nr:MULTISPECIES: amino acid ABC transporter permease [Pseudomonas]EZP68043.1 putative ABC transporter membrane protein [Pseudomonas sp. RIT357]MCT4497865.1 amino acid ABC transporter permease [Pseudomonas sivasensis]